jgi:acetoacetyl-CoA reductase
MPTSSVALVTGATEGIGRAIAFALGRAGYHVGVCARTPSRLRDLLEELSQAGITAAGHPADVGLAADVEHMIDTVTSALGPVEVLVNNAGITRDGTMHKMTYQQWNEVIQTNLTSCFNMCHAVLNGMRERGFGRIVNIGSINGQAGQYGQVNYAAAKSGIHGFTKALAQEGAAKGITVNAVAPGYIATEMVRAVPENVLEKIVARIPVGRLGEASEIARGVAFLVADEAGFITGSTLSINGGQHMY